MHTAQEKDLMPGLIAGGGGSQGNASASPSLDSSTNCLRDTTQLKPTNARRLPPAKNSTSCANKKTCDVVPPCEPICVLGYPCFDDVKVFSLVI